MMVPLRISHQKRATMARFFSLVVWMPPYPDTSIRDDHARLTFWMWDRYMPKGRILLLGILPL
jgi:hypothetical protein